MSIPRPYTSDVLIPVARLQSDIAARALVVSPKKELFLRGPVPLEWLGKAAQQPGKTFNIAVAVWWLHGMAKGKPFKLTRTALRYLNVERNAASTGLARLEEAGLIRLERRSGQRPTISIVTCTGYAKECENQSRHHHP
jgi:hypothetical protein